MKSIFTLTAIAALLTFSGCKSADNTPSGKANEGVLQTTETVNESTHQSPAEKKVMMILQLDEEYKQGKITEEEYDARRQQILGN